jgi:hypothetical protein
MRNLRSLAIVVLLLLAPGCADHVEIDPPGLINSGLLPLSSVDPFVGANVFIAKEMERSSYLYHFIETHGAPDALEIVERTFEPTKALLFYTRDKAVYSMVPRDREKLRQWVIRGPFQMNWKDIKELNRMDHDKRKRPVLYVWGREIRLNEDPVQPVARVIHPKIPPPPPPKPKKPKAKPTPKPIPPEVKEKQKELALLTLDPAKFKPLTLDQQAILISKGYVERADNGDAVHTVRRNTETLKLIARWYTGSTGNPLEKIAEANGIEPGDPLLPGSTVRVPIAVLKQIKVMPLTYE